MKSFQAVIIAAIAVSAAAINEPVASPTAAIERELAEYERQLGTDVTGAPTDIPPRPTGVSLQQSMSRREQKGRLRHRYGWAMLIYALRHLSADRMAT